MKRLKKIIFYIFLLGLLFIAGALIFSPYGRQKNLKFKAVLTSIEINAPVDSVFSYLGKSERAADWSVYVNHITPLNLNQHKDGEVGCKRRCFTKKNKSGERWDEVILHVQKNKLRRLSVFNQQNFSMVASHLLTEQRYEKITSQKTKLTLLLFFNQEKMTFSDEFKMYFAAYVVKDVFERNLKNIKKQLEKK